MHARLDAIYRLSFAIVGDEADARDATQEAFIAAWRRIRELREPDRFDAWLQRIAVNAARMTLRARGRRRVREIPAGDVAALAAVSDGTAARIDRSDADVLGAALDRLSFDQRTILVLHHLEGQGSGRAGRDPRHPDRDGQVASPHRSRGARRRARQRGSLAMTQPDWDDERLAAAFHARFDRAAPPDLAGDVRVAITETSPARASWFRPASAWAVAAAVVLVAVGGAAVLGLGGLGRPSIGSSGPSVSAPASTLRAHPSASRRRRRNRRSRGTYSGSRSSTSGTPRPSATPMRRTPSWPSRAGSRLPRPSRAARHQPLRSTARFSRRVPGSERYG